jgi:hypothetical protein
VNRGSFRSAIVARFHLLAFNHEVALKNEDLFYAAVAMGREMGTCSHSDDRSDRFLAIIDKEDFFLAACCINGLPMHYVRSCYEQSVAIEKNLTRKFCVGWIFIGDCGAGPWSRLPNGRRLKRHKRPTIEHRVDSQKKITYQACFEHKSMRTNGASFLGEIFVLMGGENDRGCLDAAVPKKAKRVDAIEFGHRYVGHDKVRREFKHAFDKCSAVAAFGNNCEVARESLGDCVHDFRYVVRQDDAYQSSRGLHRVYGAKWRTKDSMGGSRKEDPTGVMSPMTLTHARLLPFLGLPHQPWGLTEH